MEIGLKRGTVKLADNSPEWEAVANTTIEKLKALFGDKAVDIQHVGSTAVRSIKAKPIIDIAVAVRSFDELREVLPRLEANGIAHTPPKNVSLDGELLFVIGDFDEDTRTHHIHIVTADSIQWRNYIGFRDYLNGFSEKASEYENFKIKLAEEHANDRKAYTEGKKAFPWEERLFEARLWIDFNKEFSQIIPVEKGWSSDKKFRVTKKGGVKYLLRVSPIEKYEARKSLFEILKQADASGIPMCRPIDFGTCTDGVYFLQSWIDGEDLREALPMMSETTQYVFGLKAGEILRKIHAIKEFPAPETREEWETRFNRKTDMKIQQYNDCGLRFNGDNYMLDFIKQNRKLLKNRPQCFQHGDYHEGNMMIENGELKIIDFDRFDFGDPWEEFSRIVFSAAISPHFATGQIKGYFNGEPPDEFFKLLALYIACNTLSAICWAIPFGREEIDTMIKQSQDILDWYDNMRSSIPSWYLKDLYIQYADGVPYKLKSPFDFSFLRKYGRVFKVFDAQDSGNICFGTEDGKGERYFVKFAGAPAARGTVTAGEAIANLKSAAPIYEDLAHPALIRFINAEEIGGGYAVVFDWVDGICAQRMYPSDHAKFKRLPAETLTLIYKGILDFHKHIAEKGYVAIDFYDGSIMWDYVNKRVVICDIDFYQKSPYIGSMGLWGSARFVSPEERTNGALIDEVTNVYTMGATAFALFADSDRTTEKWTLSAALYNVAKKAVSDERGNRQQSLAELISEWEKAEQA